MKMRVVAIPLIAAICYGSPAVASPTTEEQMVRGRGARDRNGGGDGGSARAAGGGGDRRSGGGERTAERRGGDNRRDDGGQPRTSVARGGDDDRRETSIRDSDRRETGSRDSDRRENDRRDNNGRDGNRAGRDDLNGGERYAVPRIAGRDRDYDRGPRVVYRNRPDIHINFGGSPYRSGYRYYTPVHYDRWARSYYRWSPVSYLPLSLIYGSIGFSNFGVYGGWGNAYPYDPYAYSNGSPWRTSGYDVGGVRLKISPRDAQVFVDGYYAGLVDDFDGTFQSLRLEAGGHKIEVRMPGFADMELDVHIQPGRTITLAEVMQPRP